jgi:hypothetical protein
MVAIPDGVEQDERVRMAEKSRIYFPLAANAAGLVVGAQWAAFERRVKLAALLYDELVLDDGYWIGSSGPGGRAEMRRPRNDPGFPGLQTARERASAKALNQFSLMVDTQELAGGPAEVVWRATFDPIKQKLPAKARWVEFATFKLNDEGKQLADGLIDDDLRDTVLAGRFRGRLTRDMVVTNAGHGFALASVIDAAVSMDRVHGEVIAARVRRGVASIAMGRRALDVKFPAVGALSWSQVHEARSIRGLPKLRAVLAEIEAEAREIAATEAEIDRSILVGYDARIAAATEALKPSFRGVLTSTAISVLLSVATGTMGPAGIAAGAAAGMAIDTARFGKARWDYAGSWAAASFRLRRLTVPSTRSR